MAKTTVKVRVKRWEYFNKECKAASIRRDDFLNRALPDEIECLQSIPACDDEGERWLKKIWLERNSEWGVEFQSAPILLSDDVLAKLNQVCAEKRVPRDAFIDCTLTYFSARLYEAVIVIKKPRTSDDLVSRAAVILNDDREGIDEAEDNAAIVDEVKGRLQSWKLEALANNFYETNLSFSHTRVQEALIWASL